MRNGLAPKTIANHLRTLHAMFEYARRRRRMTSNPVELLEPLSMPQPDTPVLREEEIAALLNAYRLKENAAEPGEREWWPLAWRLTAFALGTALRRGEILALRFCQGRRRSSERLLDTTCGFSHRFTATSD